jgi:drug/metabolite transporter (DMT)-like permease
VQRSAAPEVLLVLVCFAFNSVATRLAVRDGLLDPASLTVARFVAGGAMLALVLAARRRAAAAMPARRDLLPGLLLGAYALLIAYGYVHIGAAAGTFVFYACVVATMALAGGRRQRRAVLGALVGLAGVGVLAFGRVEGASPLGVLLLAGTGVAWGAYSMALRRGGDPLGGNARAFALVAVASPFLLAAAWPPTLTPRGLALGAFMGAVTTALAYALWARVLPRIGAAQAGVYQLLVPILAGAGGVLLLGEALTARLALAAALVLAGMWMATPRPPAPALAGFEERPEKA